MPGKPWTAEEEITLKEMVKAGKPLNVIAAELDGRSEGAIFQKCKRMGLRVVVTKGYTTTTSLKLPKELPRVEEALKILAGALTAAAQHGLDKVAVSFSERDPLRRKNIGGMPFMAKISRNSMIFHANWGAHIWIQISVLW